jgi:hypothetical protein
MKASLSLALLSILVHVILNDTVETPEEATNTTNQLDEDIVYKEEPVEIVYSFSKEWEDRMYDYEPTYVYMIPVKAKGTEKFYENFSKVPKKIRGAFLTEDTKNEKIEFAVLSPQNKLIYKNFTSECIFEFEVKTPGEYSIRFRNIEGNKEIKVTFTMNTAQEEVLSKEHLSFSEKKLESLYHFMNTIKVEDNIISKQKRNRQKRK